MATQRAGRGVSLTRRAVQRTLAPSAQQRRSPRRSSHPALDAPTAVAPYASLRCALWALHQAPAGQHPPHPTQQADSHPAPALAPAPAPALAPAPARQHQPLPRRAGTPAPDAPTAAAAYAAAATDLASCVHAHPAIAGSGQAERRPAREYRQTSRDKPRVPLPVVAQQSERAYGVRTCGPGRRWEVRMKSTVEFETVRASCQLSLGTGT